MIFAKKLQRTVCYHIVTARQTSLKQRKNEAKNIFCKNRKACKELAKNTMLQCNHSKGNKPENNKTKIKEKEKSQ